MLNSKLIITKLPDKRNTATKPFMIYADDHAILERLSKETGLSMVRLLNLMLNYAHENIEVIDYEREDI